MTSVTNHPEPGEEIGELQEMLYRNVRVNFVQDAHVSSLAFEPSPNDAGLLSLDRSSLTNPKSAFELFLRRPYCSSAGILGATVQECRDLNVTALENPLKDNPAHCVADFRQHNRSQAKKRAAKLRDAAVRRGWLYVSGLVS